MSNKALLKKWHDELEAKLDHGDADDAAFEKYHEQIEAGGGEEIFAGNLSDYATELEKIIRKLGGEIYDDPEFEGSSDHGVVLFLPSNANAQRIAACLIACEGIPTEELKDVDFELISRLA